MCEPYYKNVCSACRTANSRRAYLKRISDPLFRQRHSLQARARRAHRAGRHELSSELRRQLDALEAWQP